MHPEITVSGWLRRQIASHGYALAVGSFTALLVFAAVLRENRGEPFALLAALFVPSQVCLIAIWASLSTAHLAVRLGRALLWLGGLYFCIVGPASINPSRLPTTWPLFMALAMAALGIGAALGAQVNRNKGWRLVTASQLPELSSSERRPRQFRLSDAFGWTTMICTFLGLGALTIPRFAVGEPTRFAKTSDILGPLLGGTCVALVTGVTGALVFWLVLVDRRSSGGFFQKYWQILLVLVVVGLWLDRGSSFGMGPPPFATVFSFLVGFGLPMAVNAQILRILGWSLVRVGVSTSSPSPSE